MSQEDGTYQFLYTNYRWPAEDVQRNCPFSGEALVLNEHHPGYNGKPWTCPKCIYFFSEEELENWDFKKYPDCPSTRKEQAAK